MWPWRQWRRRACNTCFALCLSSFLIILVIINFQTPRDGENDSVNVLRNNGKQLEYVDRKGIHVIVGHYIGDDLPWLTTPNLTDEILNINGYAPLPHAGENGEAYFNLPTERQKSKMLYYINKFNLVASNRISVNRSLPDQRRQVCRQVTYNTSSLPDTSVIIVFHNEAWSALVRTVHSIINRSPKHLIKEIILVDDASTRTFLKESLDEYVSHLPVSVKIVRLPERSGLIRARLFGADLATGQVLTFLDAHCECTKGWLEPLLTRIAEDRTRVVCPVIDIIHDETFAYIRSFELHWGGFNWELHFRWYAVGDRELRRRHNNSTLPFHTPVMAGGLFAIDKLYFEVLGRYDEKMDIWGGENVELSFRVWQCGGSVEIAPCSHVGHVFRKSSPYTFPIPGGVGTVLYKNLARVAIAWMDDWKEFYFKMNPEAAKLRQKIDVTSRILLREKLQCKNFKWYLDNVWPEHFLPMDDRFFGKIRSIQNSKCFQKGASHSPGQQAVGKIKLATCVYEIYARQLFIFTHEGKLMTDESICLDSPEGAEDTYVVMLACGDLQRQKWKYDPTKQTFVHVKSNLCLDLPSESRPEALTLQTCDEGRSQKWMLEHVNWK